MSATTEGGKTRLFGFLKGLFRRAESNGAEAPAPAATPPRVKSPPGAPRPAPAPRPPQNGTSNNGNGHGNGTSAPRRSGAVVPVSLQSVIAALPLELRGRVKQEDVGDLTISVPLEKVLSQLAHGSVKVPFGEVRQAAQHIFEAGAEFDRLPVILPLNEILAQLNPALLVRRTVQKQVEVPAEIVSPFEAKGQGLVFSVGNAKPVTPAAPRQAAPAPALPARGSLSSVPAAPPPPAAAPIPMPKSPIAPPAHGPISPITPNSPIAPTAPLVPPRRVTPAPAAAPMAAPTIVAPTESAKPAADSGTLSVPLKSLAEAWPEALRQEIVQASLVDARLSVPCDLIETALKRGRAVFPWKTVRSWIRPAPPPGVSAHDSAELELPLKVIAPLFLARQKSAGKSHQKVTIDEAIPNLFFGFPKPESSPQAVAAVPASGAAAVNKPVDTNYYVWNENSDTARLDETEYKRKSPTGTDFVAKYATPNEIVSRAASLDGVAGSLIALPDGLMVASRIPPELNGDTLAAFLPQIFAKVSQTTKELRMGDLNNLNFTVGNVPWKIFRVNAIFFAAFGRAAEPLPTAELAALAAELDRKNK